MSQDDSLTRSQNITLNQLQALITRVASGTKNLSNIAAQLGGSTLLGWEVSNTIGLLGPRGSGKSTILHHLWSSQLNIDRASPQALPANNSNTKHHKLGFIKPLDCSTTAGEIGVSPGVAVLLQIKHTSWIKDLLSDNSELALMLDDVIDLYFRTSESHIDLGLDLSSTAKDLSRYIREGVSARLNLNSLLTRWLDAFEKAANIDALVLLLDDFDLIPGGQVRQWQLSLLDELHQHRLITILTADFYRLDYVSWDYNAQIDDKTGRALLEKVLPPQNRVFVAPWTTSEVTSMVGFRLGEEESRDLGSLLKPIVTRSGFPEYLVNSLLPRIPRGLNNLYQLLILAQNDDTLDLPYILAISRREPLLVRRLAALSYQDWIEELHWRPGVLSVEVWHTLLIGAQERAYKNTVSRETTSSGFQSLIRAMSPLLDTQSSQRRTAPGSYKKSPFKSTSNMPDSSRDALAPEHQHPPEWHDALRHDHLRQEPLRDASVTEQPLWAELLADKAMRIDPWSRLRFLKLWDHGRSLVESAQLTVSIHPDRARAFLQHQYLLSTSSKRRQAASLTFPWWDVRLAYGAGGPSGGRRATADAELTIGWAPLLGAVTGQRETTPNNLLSALRVRPTFEVSPTIDANALERGLRILPDELWAMILLLDGLSRAPWEAWSARTLSLDLLTYIGMTTVFARGAYLYALWRAGAVELDELSPLSRQVVSGYAHRRSLLNLYDAEGGRVDLQEDLLRSWIKAAILEPLPAGIQLREDTPAAQDTRRQQPLRGYALEPTQPDDEPTDALTAAATAFFSLPAYNDVKDLLTGWA